MSDVMLPRRDSDGNYYISYSQFTSWKDLKSFNLGVRGNLEYMLSYFFGEDFGDAGWAQFGSEVEDYICQRLHADKFTDKERETMEKIVPLGNFQIETKLWLLPNVYVKGFIDDATQDMMKIRDYKTASNSSRQRYYKDDYVQLDSYALWVQQETGKIPDELEVCIIERKGNCFGMKNARERLSVGTEIWYHPRITNQERLDKVRADILTAVFQISDAYKTFLKIHKLTEQ